MTFGFQMCSILWISGAALFLLWNLYNKYRLSLLLASAKALGEEIYEVPSIHLPVQTGILKKKWYLPPEFHASELQWLLRHMENRGAEPLKRIIILVIMSIHWFNPVMWLYYFLWSKDNEIHADERAVYRGNLMKRREYAQSIMNFRYRTYTHKNAAGIYEEDKVSDNFGIYAVYERDTEKRARRMMYQKWDNAGKKLYARVFVLGVLVIYFLLTPLSQVWAGGTWGAGSNKQAEADNSAASIKIKKRQVIANIDTMSPEGLGRVLQLEMKSGGSKDDDGYDGSFSLVMYDQMENKLSYLDMDMIFSHNIKSSYHFSENLSLFVSDYNGDGKQEVALGQKLIMTQNEFAELFDKDAGKKAEDYNVFQYSLINIDTNQLTVLNQGILSVVKKTDAEAAAKAESVSFGTIDGVSGIFYTEFADAKKYYEWDGEETYIEKDYTEEEMEAKKNGIDLSVSGDVKEHTLQDAGGDTAILVTTKTDSTSSEVIQSVILSPRKSEKKFEDIRGYYCDLFWAPSLGVETEEQYAVLLYNGSNNARTFVIYDLKQKSVYYQQEDGATNLAKIFKQYHEDDITFEEGGVVLYELSEKNGDTLKIGFSAAADGGISVKGSYEYNVTKKAAANLSFSRSIDEQAEIKSTPSPEVD